MGTGSQSVLKVADVYNKHGPRGLSTEGPVEGNVPDIQPPIKSREL